MSWVRDNYANDVRQCAEEDWKRYDTMLAMLREGAMEVTKATAISKGLAPKLTTMTIAVVVSTVFTAFVAATVIVVFVGGKYL